jgi:hypothetical protein
VPISLIIPACVIGLIVLGTKIAPCIPLLGLNFILVLRPLLHALGLPVLAPVLIELIFHNQTRRIGNRTFAKSAQKRGNLIGLPTRPDIFFLFI